MLMRSASVRPTLTPSRALRVVHVASRVSPEGTSGVEAAVYYLSRAQAALGHDVRVVPVDDPSDARRSRDRGAWHGLRAGQLRAVLRPRPALVAAVLAARPDFVHFHSVHVPDHIGLATVLRGAGIPYCVTTHGGLAPQARQRGRLRKAFFGWLCERRYLHRAAFLHALTADEATAMRWYGLRVPIVTVPNGFDTAILQPARNPWAFGPFGVRGADERIFLYVGRLDTVTKGLDLLVDALAETRTTGARLAIVGPDWYGQQAALMRRVRMRALDDRVRFFGPAFGQHKTDLLAAADVFVHPSRSEGVSLSVLEAAGSGKPCLLTYAADPLGAVARGGGGLTVAPAVPALVEAIETLTGMDRPALAQMGARARAVVEAQFTWSGAAQTLADAYASAAGTRDGQL